MYKNFGATVALNDVSFVLCRGEIRGLVGENGSGKSTVSSIIAGIQPATKGEMVYKGKPWKPESTLKAQEAGIGMIMQEAGTIPNITVAENIFLGHEDLFMGMTRLADSRKKMNDRCRELFDSLGLTGLGLEPDMVTGELD
ncbi:MAG: sugar ABC transporter ATP-binding protein, partial [Lachnospiraceae bacterium]|nr:sugar ABC transporter ATP-binding protein [Lachnospiraceae bacterium]